jgi:membrane protein implicated in regulation of membrane protease activity
MFEDFGWIAWVGIALALGAVEALTVDFVFLMLAGGALGGAVASALGASFPVQAIVAALVSCLLLVGVRPWAKRRFSAKPGRALMGVAGNVGRAAYVLDTVTATDGRVKLGGETWSARTHGEDAIAPGEEVRVVAIDGATAVVARPPAPLP